MDIIFNVITVIICVAIILVFRQADKNSRSIEKAKKYGDMIKNDLEEFVNGKNAELTDLTTELKVQQTQAIAAVKKLDDVYKAFMENTHTLDDKVGKIQEIDGYIAKSEQTIQKLMDMTSLAETNLTEIAKESKFVDSLAKAIQRAHKDLDDLYSVIPELHNKFIQDADSKLIEYKEKIMEELGADIHDIESRLNVAKKDTNELVEVASIKLQDLYKKAYEEAADSASSLQTAAFAKLKEETATNVQNYRQEFDDTASRLRDEFTGTADALEQDIKTKISETQQMADEFKTEWNTQAKDYLAQMQADFEQTATDVNSRMEVLLEKLKETENAVSLRSDSLSSDLNQTEATMRSQFNSLASNFQDKITSLSKFTDKKLNEFKLQTENRFTKFEDTISSVDVLKEEIEKSQLSIKEELLKEITDYKNSITQQQQKFTSEFEANSSKIKGRMNAIEGGIDNLKSKAYTNVSEKLKMFEDDFFADLAKRSDAINLSFDQWKEDVSTNMVLLASENESERKNIELEYKKELKERVVKISEDYKALFLKLDEKVVGAETTLTNRLSGFDDKIETYAEKFKEEINETKSQAIQVMDTELDSYKMQLKDAIENQNAELENNSKALNEKIISMREDSQLQLGTIKKDFDNWKLLTDKQFNDARELFEDKINSIENLTKNAIKNLDSKYNTQYKDFVAKTGESFDNIQTKVETIDKRLDVVNKELDNNAQQAVAKMLDNAKKVSEQVDKKLESSKTEAERSIQNIQGMILTVKAELDETQEKVREQIQTDSIRLNSVLEEINKKQNDFITQTKVFERADELKEGLEKDIAHLKTEVTRFDVYKNAMDDLSLQYEKVNHLEEEAKKKVAKFMEERKNIELLESEFLKLTSLSQTIDNKIIELTGVSDDLQQYQVQIRKLEDGIIDVNTRYERLEKKGTVLDQTVDSIDSAFEDLKKLENDIKDFKNEVGNFPPQLEKIQVTVESLVSSQSTADEVCEKIGNLDEILEDLNSKMDSLKQARSWLAATETRLEDISKNSEAQLKLMADLFKSEKPERNSGGAPTIGVQENVLKLSRQGWKTEEISKALGLSFGEVELILEYADKI